MKTKQYVDLISSLYNITETAKQQAMDRAAEIDEKLSWYSDWDIENEIKEYYIYEDKKFPPKLGGILLLLDHKGKKKRVKQEVPNETKTDQGN